MHEIKLEHIHLEYDLHFDKTTNLKEFVINFFNRRKYVSSEKKKEKFLAVNDVSLHIKNGDRVGIIGANGAGKSTLLKIISGVLHPTGGRLVVHGNIQPLIEVGAGFNPEFSGRENIYLNGYMLGFSKKQVRSKEQEIIDFAELNEFIDVPIKYYSSGMAVRLAFAIATSIEPEILVFDEMLSAGDLHFMKKAQDRMDSLLKMAKILVVVTHDFSLLAKICTTVVVMSKGKIVYSGPTKDAIEFYKKNFS